MDEKELIKKLQQGDKNAEELFFKKYSPLIFNVAFQITRRRSIAEDVVQDAFLAAFKNIKKFKSASRLSTWLYRIAANRAKYVVAREEKQRKWEENAVEKSLPDIPKEYEGNRLKEIIWLGMEELGENEREIITLIDIEGMKYEEASKLLNVPVGTVRSRISRARSHLKDIIMKRNFFEEGLSKE